VPKVFLEALEFVQNTLKSAKAEDFRKRLAARLPFSTVFLTAQERTELRNSKSGEETEEAKKEMGPL